MPPATTHTLPRRADKRRAGATNAARRRAFAYTHCPTRAAAILFTGVYSGGAGRATLPRPLGLLIFPYPNTAAPTTTYRMQAGGRAARAGPYNRAVCLCHSAARTCLNTLRALYLIQVWCRRRHFNSRRPCRLVPTFARQFRGYSSSWTMTIEHAMF